MNRQESAQVLKEVVIYRRRGDVPPDVVEAMDVAMQVFASEPRMTREKEARLTQLENVLRAILDEARCADGMCEMPVEVIEEARALLDAEGTSRDAG